MVDGKRTLLLGAGLVTRPLVRYLLDQPGYNLTIATRTVSKAEKLLDGHPRGKSVAWTVDDLDSLQKMIDESDLVISLLPAAHHVTVAKMCIEKKKMMVTTSYVSPEMKALDGPAKKAGILILNEIGVDPGIDHMSAMRVIHSVNDKGGKVVSFKSYCGGLPAPEANTNPFGYKFSWSPKAVLLAARNPARYLENGKEVNVPGPDLFDYHQPLSVEPLGDFEVYPNRNSLGYIDVYGLKGIKNMFRGTIRNLSHCRAWKKFADMNLLDTKEIKLNGMTYRQLIARLINCGDPTNIRKCIADFAGIEEGSQIIDKMEWLGLLDDVKIPFDKASPIDIMVELLWRKLPYEKGERDMIVLHHDFVAEYPGAKKEHITSTLIDFGVPNGDSSMARTVSLPAAIAVKMIYDGKIDITGVYIPVEPEIYNPVLDELANLGIECKEKWSAM